MFSGCSSLKELNISHFNINNEINMEYLFSRCSSLKEIKFPIFNPSNTIGMSHMFNKCSNEKQYDNIQFILATLLVLKLERFNSFNEEHP